MLGRILRDLGFVILDWTEKATPPAGLTPAERRQWMDTDMEGGQVFAFCHDACINADIVIYFGESGQDAGVEVGLACGAGKPILGIRGPLEAPGLMLHGAINLWVEAIEDAISIMHDVAQHLKGLPTTQEQQHIPLLCAAYRKRCAFQCMDASSGTV